MDTRMALGVRSVCRCTAHPGRSDCADGRRSPLRTDDADAAKEVLCCLKKTLEKWRPVGAVGMFAHGMLSMGMVFLLVQCALANEGETTYDASGSSSSPAASASPLAHVPPSTAHWEAEAASQGGGLRGLPAYSSILTFPAGTAQQPLSLIQSRTSPTITRDKSYTSQRPSDDPRRASDTPPSAFFSSDFNRAHDSTKDKPPRFVFHTIATTIMGADLTIAIKSHPVIRPAHNVSHASVLSRRSRILRPFRPLAGSDVDCFCRYRSVRSEAVCYGRVQEAGSHAPQGQGVRRGIGVCGARRNHIPGFSATTRRPVATVAPRTPFTRRNFSPHIPRTAPPRAASTYSPNRLDTIQRQNLRRGLSQGLRKALNDSLAQAQVETVFGSPNMTVAYHVTGEGMVYTPSAVLQGLGSYGRDRLIADLRQYLPMVTALPVPTALWRPTSATGFQLQTVLRFVGVGDNPRSCRFSQMMEQRLENAFSEAQAKLLGSHHKLSVQMLSVAQVSRSPAVSLVYSVRNGSAFLNGTTASNLLGRLTAELVGYYLFYPPLVIAERKCGVFKPWEYALEYHNLNSSIATRHFWVITVIHDVDDVSLDGHYQSFASLMERRLAELFVAAGQQGPRFKRATTVGSYTVQMVSIRRLEGLKSRAEMTYYAQHHGVPLAGASAAKVLNTVDSQTMALTLGYFVQLQAEPVVKNPPNNLWILAAVLAPIAVMAYRRDVGYFHQPVQGFDYAKQHLGQQGGDEDVQPVSQDTLMMSLPLRDAPLSLALEKPPRQESMASKKSHAGTNTGKRMPTEDGSVIGNESEKRNPSRGLTVQKVPAQQKVTKEEQRRRDDPYDSSSGSLQLICIKPTAAQASYSQPVSLALKQKSDIEHYRNKLRLKAKRKGYYDFPSTDAGSRSGSHKALDPRPREETGHRRTPGEPGRPPEPDEERGSTFLKSGRRHSQVGQPAYRSKQSINSPSPGGTEIDLLVMRERPRRGIRNSGYDETNVDRLMGPRGYLYGHGVKGHSETSTLSSQPSIDEVRQQMHLLLEEAFSLASGGGGHSTSGRHSHHHHPNPGHYGPAPPPLPFSDVITSAPGTMGYGRGGLQWAPSYGVDPYQCSIPKPAFRFTQLPDMALGSPPPSWMSYPPEPEDIPPQWAESVPLPGYVEAFPLPRYPQSSPPLLPLPYIQAMELLPSAPTPAAKQSSPLAVKNIGSLPLTSLSTSALVQAIRLEVAKLAKKQSDMFEFQV
ncbi:hypothetical protein NHX12_005378 [Muraenolepis orangiensis]|uniref:Uncharacterized protein n=1 Tax=Muraenolepis orangiensis TaxID=630683 RepID=A0A9Q0DQJ7_9TELE|nr:hypothetical protein NHX12_005378 [Muraenolepis orangiensis]